jgi:1-acyl-sn-glycerol-3-phosphate acyltransferase
MSAALEEGELARPPGWVMDAMVRALEPARLLASPVLVGLENIPAEGPVLFVGNHTLFGVLDAPILIAELWRQRRIALRPLGDDLHFRVPVWRWMSRSIGAVPASPAACARLIEAGERILVFPGGAREVSKRKGEKYKLVWGERLGFARLAIQHACPVVPFACVGVEDAFDILVDADEILASRVGPFLRRLGVRRDLVWPIVKGLGPTPLPRLERQYFGFGAAIETSAYGQRADPERAAELRDRVKAAIEAEIEALLALRERDPDRSFRARLSHRLGVFGARALGSRR